MIYLDNGATTLYKPPQVAEAMVSALQTMGNSSRGAYPSALKAARTVYSARCRLAELFACPRPDHVIFTANATEALNTAISGLFRPGDHVISTDLEHNSVLRPLYRMEAERGLRLSFVPADKRGCVDYGDFERLICPQTRAIVCTHVSNLTGNLLDLEKIGEVARKHGLLFLVDAAQSAGSIPISMKTMDIDVLCFTGHKGLMGPQGTGGLCLREGVDIAPWKVGGSGVQSFRREQPSEYPLRLEAGTLNVPGIAGLDAALQYLMEIGVEQAEQREQSLMRRFYQGVKNIPGVKIYGDFDAPRRGATVALNIRDYDSGAVADELAQTYGIEVRAGAHCAPRMHRALGTEETGVVRFSFSLYNREEEVDAAISAVKEIAQP